MRVVWTLAQANPGPPSTEIGGRSPESSPRSWHVAAVDTGTRLVSTVGCLQKRGRSPEPRARRPALRGKVRLRAARPEPSIGWGGGKVETGRVLRSGYSGRGGDRPSPRTACHSPGTPVAGEARRNLRALCAPLNGKGGECPNPVAVPCLRTKKGGGDRPNGRLNHRGRGQCPQSASSSPAQQWTASAGQEAWTAEGCSRLAPRRAGRPDRRREPAREPSGRSS